MRNKDINVIVGAVVAACASVALLVLASAATAFFWNRVMPEVFSLGELTFSQAFSLVALAWIVQFPRM